MNSDPNAPLRPIFYDESRRRWSWIVRLGTVLLAAAAIAVVCFCVSVLALPLLPHNALPRARETLDAGNAADPKITDRQRARRHFVFKKEKRELEQLRAIDRAARAARKLPPAPGGRLIAPFNGQTVVAGFYVNWEETSRASLRKHIGELTHFFPEWMHLGHDGRTIIDARIPEDRTDIGPFVRSHGVPIIALINNYTDGGGWDAQAVHNLVSIPLNRAVFIMALRSKVVAEHWQGVNIDLEDFSPEDRSSFTEFMRELYAAFHPFHLAVTEDVEMGSDLFDLPQLAQCNDAIIPMLYDEHSPNDGNGSGSIAGIPWTRDCLADVTRQVPASKLILGLGNYSYDWPKGNPAAATLTYQSAVVQAKESEDPTDASQGQVKIDPASLNPYYRYLDDADKPHVVWMMDATTVYNQWRVAQPYHPRGYALWYLGAEDPSLWGLMGRTHIRGLAPSQVAQGALDKITYGRESEVDFEGEGELLDVVAQPNEGDRTVAVDPKSGLITAEAYKSYPSSYVVRRYGYRPKSIVLTFDDGPDPTWTPQILDILQREHVPGTFFVIGKQAEENPSIVAREWEMGEEIGNHTYNHPNLAETRSQRTKLEISATQRIIEAITDHSTTLFRPPYAIDVEPRTGGELRPIILASQFNFISVGEKIDPQDWNLPLISADGKTGAARIEESVWNDRDTGNVVLFHDGGGDRSATVQALPVIIERLKRAGYHFISVADLRGVSREALFPPVTGRDVVLVGVDKYVFEATYLVQRTLVTLFTLSVVLGVSRQLWMAILALVQRRRERTRESRLLQDHPLGDVGSNSDLVQGLRQRPGPTDASAAHSAHASNGLALGPELANGVGTQYDSSSRLTPHSSRLPQSSTLTTQPSVTVIIAAYNEAKVIARTVSTVLESDYPDLAVIVVDDGSTDDTFAVVTSTFAADGRVSCIRKENGGKASALEAGIAQAQGEVIVALDADTLFAPDAIARLVRHFADPAVGAVSGNVRVGNANNILTRWQALEYITSQNFDRRAYDLMNCITVVPGAVGAWRRIAIVDAGGYASDTLAEDTDLTWKVRRAGWRILNDSSALAYTEAPETLRDLSRQRFRWAFGTLQNLWKHRSALGHYGAFGCVALPSLWLYQIVFPAISPIMDLTVVWALIAGSTVHVLAYYGLMVGVEFLGAALALKMDRGDWRLLPWLFLQRFVYRQLMYYVVLKSLWAAIHGGAVGWNKFERRGTARLDAPAPDLAVPTVAPAPEPAAPTVR